MVRGIVKILHDDVFLAHCETVAVTRARALLIVVGDPDILSRWRLARVSSLRQEERRMERQGRRLRN